MPKLSMPLVRVILADETEHTVQTITADAIRWDITRAKHNWPTVTRDGSSAVLWLSFLAWHALHRTGATDQTWETFSASVVDVSEAGSTPVDPTQEDHTPG